MGDILQAGFVCFLLSLQAEKMAAWLVTNALILRVKKRMLKIDAVLSLQIIKIFIIGL